MNEYANLTCKCGEQLARVWPEPRPNGPARLIYYAGDQDYEKFTGTHPRWMHGTEHDIQTAEGRTLWRGRCTAQPTPLTTPARAGQGDTRR